MTKTAIAKQDVSDEIVYLDPPTADELGRMDVTPEGIKAYIESLGLTAADLIYQGDPFPLANKEELVDVPLFFVAWSFGFSTNFGTEYVNIRAVRLDNAERVSIFDTGTGIYESMKRETDRRYESNIAAVSQGLQVMGGLRRSDYPANDERPGGTTFYLN